MGVSGLEGGSGRLMRVGVAAIVADVLLVD